MNLIKSTAINSEAKSHVKRGCHAKINSLISTQLRLHGWSWSSGMHLLDPILSWSSEYDLPIGYCLIYDIILPPSLPAPSRILGFPWCCQKTNLYHHWLPVTSDQWALSDIEHTAWFGQQIRQRWPSTCSILLWIIVTPTTTNCAR